MRPLVVAVVAVLAAAGCLSPDPLDPADAEGGPSTLIIDEDRPATTFTDVTTGPAADADENATLDAPPTLVAGEWWRLRFDTSITDAVDEVVRVVAAVEDDAYIMGMPHEGWYKEAISMHAPAFGDVGLDLSYLTHNERFQPLKFPLVEGDSWETVFATAPLVATVERVEGTRATVVFTAPASEDPADPVYAAVFGMSASGEFMRLIYDASAHEVVTFSSGIGGYEVLAHGYGYEGWVTIPRGHDTAIDYGQLGPVTPGDPVLTREIDVAGGFNRLTLMHAVFPLSPGVYRIRAVAPDGTEFMTESTSGDPVLRFYEATSPDGTWTSEDVVAGVGVTYSMGIAYHQYDILLPDGTRRSDHAHPVVR